MFLYWAIVFPILKSFYLSDGFPDCLLSFAFFYKDQKSKILVGAPSFKSVKWVFSGFHWTSPGSLRGSNLEPLMLYYLICFGSQDHQRSLRSKHFSLLSLVPIKWFLLLFQAVVENLWELLSGENRAPPSLSLEVTWISLSSVVMVKQAGSSYLNSKFWDNKRSKVIR